MEGWVGPRDDMDVLEKKSLTLAWKGYNNNNNNNNNNNEMDRKYEGC